MKKLMNILELIGIKSSSKEIEMVQPKKLSEIKRDFNHFIDSIPEYMRILKNILKLDELKFSLEEIEMVEQFYTKYHRETDKIGLTKEEIDIICTAYLGEAHLWHFGGEWELETSKAGDYGAFQIVKYGGEGYHWTALTPKNWLFFIETKQSERRLATIFGNGINYFNNSPEFVLKPVRNLY